MLIVAVHARIKPEHVQGFREACLENARNSIQEPGVVRFDVLQQTDDPTRFMLYEVYRSPDDPPKHRETPHYNAWLAKVTDMFAEPRTRQMLSNVFPPDQAW